MFVEDLLPGARERLVTIAEDAPLIEAARLLHTGTDILVVCRATGVLAGIITKTNVVGQIGRCQGSSCTVPVALVWNGTSWCAGPASGRGMSGKR